MTLEDRLLAAGLITGEFTLRSGATSSVYFDKYLIESDPRLLEATALGLAGKIPFGCEVLAGPFHRYTNSRPACPVSRTLLGAAPCGQGRGNPPAAGLR